MKGRVASAYAASAGRAEGNELLAGEIIAFQEGIDDPGHYAPPDREAHNHGIVASDCLLSDCFQRFRRIPMLMRQARFSVNLPLLYTPFRY